MNGSRCEHEQECHEKLFPGLRFSKKAADFLMARVECPKGGKSEEYSGVVRPLGGGKF